MKIYFVYLNNQFKEHGLLISVKSDPGVGKKSSKPSSVLVILVIFSSLVIVICQKLRLDSYCYTNFTDYKNLIECSYYYPKKYRVLPFTRCRQELPLHISTSFHIISYPFSSKSVCCFVSLKYF